MLEFSDLSINNQELFIRYLKEAHYEASEMNFTNFFMWRDMHGFRFAEIDGFLCVISVPKKGEPYAMLPIGSGDAEQLDLVIYKLIQYFKDKNWTFQIKRLEEGKVKALESLKSYKFQVIEDRDNSDYIYGSSDLINLKGKKYDGKRNHLNKFRKTYSSYEYKQITRDDIANCKDILERWCAERVCDENSDFNCEKLANFELLDNYEKLGVKGAIVYVNGNPEAFTVGELLNNNTAVIHIEKANSTINGLYPFINQQFCLNEWSSIEFINREQDLGIEGLRKAKLSYNPLKLVNKYAAVLIE